METALISGHGIDVLKTLSMAEKDGWRLCEMHHEKRVRDPLTHGYRKLLRTGGSATMERS
jgi:hypothetical protein